MEAFCDTSNDFHIEKTAYTTFHCSSDEICKSHVF